MREARIVVTTRVEGRHRWPDAVGELRHLSFPHRHLFHWRAELLVTDLDRQVSFEQFRADLEHFAKNELQVLDCTKSCEQLAEDVLNALLNGGYPTITAVECWEDGENGARSERRIFSLPQDPKPYFYDDIPF